MAIAKRGSTLRAQWLGQLLRKERERSGVTNREAGEYLQRDGSAISRMEAGVTPARVADVWALMNLYGTAPATRPVLEQLSREIWHKGWWEGYRDPITDSFIDHAWLEDRAERIESFEPVTVPGLLQTREYASALFSAADPDLSPQQHQRAIDYRLARQQVLAREEAPRAMFVLDEATLHRQVGGPTTTRAQLKRVIELSELATVDIRVLEFRSGAHASPDGPFTVIRLPEPFPPVVYAPSAGGAAYLEQEQAKGLIGIFGEIGRLAAEPDRSREIIESIAGSMT